ncbi:hypothetical protein GCM10010449_05590 [Streptomyces rectiviolaceus]|uniref:DUF7224 domain-containing protein n=2 Tax=Streptomyces rectiviolaceus TaxID=332591 RepID=A0ABP6M6V3_9ACTN
MPWRALLRTSGAVWGLLPACAWMWFYARQPDALVSAPEGYWEAATAHIAVVGIVPLTLCAATGAWEAVRIRRSGLIDRGAAARSPLVVALSQLRTVWGAGLLCVMVALACVAERAMGGPGGPDLRVLALLGLLVTTYTLAGYAVGWLLPWMLTVPVVAVAAFLWLSYPVSMEPLWLRQLNGTNLNEGWAYERTLDARALIAPGLVAAGLLLAALIVMVARAHVVRLTAMLPVTVAIAVAVPMVMPLEYDPTKARDTSTLSCAGAPIRVCLWPEQSQDTEKFRPWVENAAVRLKEAGVKLPKTYTPTFSDPTRADVVMSLVSGILPDPVPVCSERHTWPGEEAYAPVAMWLELTAGGNAEDVADRIDDGGKMMSLVQDVRKLPATDQTQWYSNNRSTLTRCDLKPQLTTTTYKGGTR